jgi:hypothetical protein
MLSRYCFIVDSSVSGELSPGQAPANLPGGLAGEAPSRFYF